MTTTRGVKKVNENILSPGRAIIVTDKDKDQYKWDEIPVGSKFIDTKTGIEQVKLEDVVVLSDGTYLSNALVQDGKVYKITNNLVNHKNGDGIDPYYKPGTKIQYTASEVKYQSQTDWIPAGIKNDGTICIAKDAIVVSETFVVVNPETANDGTFEYINANGEHRHMPVIKTSDGSIGYVFELEKGTYQMWRNHLTIIVDDVLHRDERSGGIEELTPTRFALFEKLEIGHKITAKYYRIMRIGNPYPRFFISDQVPESAEYGDFWLDYNATMQEYDILTENGPSNTTTVSYNNVTGKPTTLSGYGITDKVAAKYHTHTQDDFIDWPKDTNGKYMPLTIKIKQGDVDSIKSRGIGTNPGSIVYIGLDGIVPSNLLKTTVIDGTKFYISTNEPTSPENNSIWADLINMVFKYRRNGVWDTFGTIFRNE